MEGWSPPPPGPTPEVVIMSSTSKAVISSDNVLYVKSCDLKLRTLISFFVHFHAYPFLLVLNYVRAGLDSHGAAGALITCTNGVGTIVALCRGDLSNACRD